MLKDLALDAVATPSFVLDLGAFRRNLRLLNEVQEASGAHVLLALKGFSMWGAFAEARPLLSGACASSLWEAQLAREEMRGEVHTYSPGFQEEEFPEILRLSDHVVFNTLSQWSRFRAAFESHVPRRSAGLRINPEHREVEVELYDPCGAGSRLGTTLAELERHGGLQGLEGLHFHNLCQKNVDALERTWAVVRQRFAPYLKQVKWLNLGGGHHITRPDYDRERLVRVLRQIREEFDVEVYLEPGEAVALNAGVLVTSVVDLMENGGKIAILDTSATAHMPDVLEMPYRPEIVGAGEAGELGHDYRLGGTSCLAGDIIGTYSFPEPLQLGQRLVFLDMAHYTMVKTSFFNGVRHPDIATYDPETGAYSVLRRFTYADFRGRLS